jgi:hypothetical protein
MLRTLAGLVALVCAMPAGAKVWQEVRPLQEQRSFVIESDGVVVRVAPVPHPEDETEETDSYEDVAIEVQFPGLPAFRVPRDEYRSSIYGIRVGIGRMAPGDAAPTVLLAGYSGGAHCCATMQAVSLVDGRPIATSLPMKDGDPPDAFPTDIDGDGVREFEWIDGSLLYAFTSYASSWPVPKFYHLRDGELVDVSREPGFAPSFAEFAAEALAECRKQESENAGACAAHAYAMAVQGKAEQGIRTAVRLAGEPSWYPADCLVEWVDDQCPAGQERTFAGFEDALRWMMREHGYLPEGASPALAH